MRTTSFFAAVIAAVLFSFGALSADLKDSGNGADYLIITNQEFTGAIDEFVLWRESKGLEVFKAGVDEIAAEFGDEETALNEAIREFISYAQTYWQKTPDYVLLAGSVDKIPSWRAESIVPEMSYSDSISYDHPYMINIYQNDVIPDIAVGRFPARNAEDLRNMIEKTIRFEDELTPEDYKYDAAYLISKDNFSMFNDEADEIEQIFPSGFSTVKMTNNEGAPFYASKSEMLEMMSGKTRLLVNLHPANPNVWFRFDGIQNEDFDQISGDKPFVRISYASEQYFDNPEGDYYITDKLLAMRDKGCAAFVGPSDLQYFSSLRLYMKTFMEIFAQPGKKNIGDVFLQTKIEQAEAFKRDVINLLGDPALEIDMDNIQDVPYSFEDEAVITFPNPFRDELRIEMPEDYGAVTSVKITDQFGRTIKELQSAGTLQWKPENIASGQYFVIITTTDRRYVKKVIYAK